MEIFDRLSGVAVPLPMINVDTDQVIPKQYLKSIERTGLGKGLFHDLRYDMEDRERPDFVLNREPYRKSKILITGENFGCGSSREHAPWALADFGIRCVVAPSFADIFFNNSMKNGLLLIVMPQEQVDILMADAENPDNCVMTVDLETQTITRPDGAAMAFEIEPFRKARLLNGLDDIGLTLQKVHRIEAFEARQKADRPWLYA
jgi:3-isopropylmalate/(R)-2-methylmalate dehydratase small subunit